MEVKNMKNFSKWFENQQNITRIENNDTFMEFYLTLKPEDKILLYGSHKKQLKSIFGRQTGCWQSFERHWMWKIDFKSKTFLIHSATNKGTGIEIIGDSQEDIYSEESGKIAAEFVNDLISKLR